MKRTYYIKLRWVTITIFLNQGVNRSMYMSTYSFKKYLSTDFVHLVISQAYQLYFYSTGA